MLEGKPHKRRFSPSKCFFRDRSRSCDIAVGRGWTRTAETSMKHWCHTLANTSITRERFATRPLPSLASWWGDGSLAWLLPRASTTAFTYAPSRVSYATPRTPIPSCAYSIRSTIPRYEATLPGPIVPLMSFHVGGSISMHKVNWFFSLVTCLPLNADRVGTPLIRID